MNRAPLLAAGLIAAALAFPGSALGQHGPTDGHLLGTGAFGKVELVGQVQVHDAFDDAVADVAVDPDGDYAYLANWGAQDCAGPETGGRTTPDAGVYVIDISDLENPVEVGFIPMHQDTRPGEGMQVVNVTTPFFSGDILAVNEEACGKNFKAGFSLWDVTDPLHPVKLAKNFGDRTIDGLKAKGGDANQTHSAFVWDAGDSAYIVVQDEMEFADVDIFDITNPKKPVLISELNLNDFGVNQPELGLTDSDLHDMIVKEIDGRFLMLLSYWDGGWVVLDVTDPANPEYLSDTDYPVFDQLFPTITPPEGNGHQAEFTADNRFIIGTDEDFAPFRLTVNTNDGASYLAKPGTQTTIEEAEVVAGTTFFVGRACPGDPAVPAAPATGGPYIAVVERGVCFFEEKVTAVVAAGGYDAVIIMNREGADGCNSTINPSLDNDTLPVVFIGRESGFGLFDIEGTFDIDACLAGDGSVQSGIAIGTTGDVVTGVTSAFDGWGYVRLFDAATLVELDQYAISEAMSPAFAEGFGDLSVHEVAVDPQDPSLAYLSYYAGGFRAIQIQCTNPAVTSTCSLVEVGGYLDPLGNDIWGVETLVRDGTTYILASERDSGLLIFQDP